MLLAKVKDFRLRKKFLKFENKTKIIKFVYINLLVKSSVLKKGKTLKKIPLLQKAFYMQKKLKYLRNSKVKLVRRCLYTDRTRNVHKSYHLARNVFRDLIQFGLIPGHKKAAW